MGIDPNPALRAGHHAIKGFIAENGETSEAGCARCFFRQLPFEDYTRELCQKDFAEVGGAPTLALVSPPYFDWEIYSQTDGQQSFYPGMSLDGWRSGWFHPAIDLAWDLLAPGGHLALYLADAGGIDLVEALHRHMVARGRGGCYLGVVWCARGSKRALPLWIWRRSS